MDQLTTLKQEQASDLQAMAKQKAALDAQQQMQLKYLSNQIASLKAFNKAQQQKLAAQRAAPGLSPKQVAAFKQQEAAMIKQQTSQLAALTGQKAQLEVQQATQRAALDGQLQQLQAQQAAELLQLNGQIQQLRIQQTGTAAPDAAADLGRRLMMHAQLQPAIAGPAKGLALPQGVAPGTPAVVPAGVPAAPKGVLPQLLPLRQGSAAPSAAGAAPTAAAARGAVGLAGLLPVVQPAPANASAAPAAAGLPTGPAARPSSFADSGCATVSAVTRPGKAVFPPPGAKRLVPEGINGTVVVTNKGPFTLSFERVGVRLCRRLAEHIRVEAVCPSMDVPAGARVVCKWNIPLPARSQPNDWTGVVSGVVLSLGDRCASATVAPFNGANEGTCTPE
ncbi:hypothetical protein MNEG_4504 [Monoraphidium neglectum]|uniref:Uncharacterized protein n=1 Tax=Monoraphidium neglectum TaxID=145388 RepID=A0A0D2MSN5_9CHLO|nr:hypothetical protein MNEG_4504 [Monoraphidium neglectum]KIZ03447.1 hypothetical protein MNEG_4504 [Monoraphidium neglectum]|eukprot:XP_013902466.1 hypothetical protein MNEG_4504 [Monoraphidium neglectum]